MTNAEVIQRVGIPSLFSLLSQRRLKWLGAHASYRTRSHPKKHAIWRAVWWVSPHWKTTSPLQRRLQNGTWSLLTLTKNTWGNVADSRQNGQLLLVKVSEERKPHDVPSWPTRELGGRQEKHPSWHLTRRQPHTPAQSARETATPELNFTATLEDVSLLPRTTQCYIIICRDEWMPTQ